MKTSIIRYSELRRYLTESLRHYEEADEVEVEIVNHALDTASKTTQKLSDADREGFGKIVKELRRIRNYNQFVSKLDQLVRDPKSRAFLSWGFGNGKLSNDLVSHATRVLPVKWLKPMQNEIGIEEALGHSATNPDDMANMFKKGSILGSDPILVYRTGKDYYIIDGHHRWSQVASYNYDQGTMQVEVFEGDASPMQILRAIQGAIGVALGKIPSSKTGTNLLDPRNNQATQKYLTQKLTDDSTKVMTEKVSIVSDKASAIRYTMSNIVKLQQNNQPMENAPDRAEMPQTTEKDTKTGVDGEDVARKGLTII